MRGPKFSLVTDMGWLWEFLFLKIFPLDLVRNLCLAVLIAETGNVYKSEGENCMVFTHKKDAE